MTELKFYLYLLIFGISIAVAIKKVVASEEPIETYHAIYNLVCIIFRIVFYLFTSI
jgi:hypothetical protein